MALRFVFIGKTFILPFFSDYILNKLEEMEARLTTNLTRVKRGIVHDLKKVRQSVDELRGAVHTRLMDSTESADNPFQFDRFKTNDKEPPFEDLEAFEDFNVGLEEPTMFSALVSCTSLVFQRYRKVYGTHLEWSRSRVIWFGSAFESSNLEVRWKLLWELRSARSWGRT